MTPLSRCEFRDRSRRILSPLAVVSVLLLAALAGGLAVAQTHLRFRIRDLKIETRKLQQECAELSNRHVALKADIERMRRTDGEFETYARTQLGLSECPPERKVTASVSPESVARWQTLARAADAPRREALPRVVRMAEFGQRMMSLSTPAQAREVERRTASAN